MRRHAAGEERSGTRRALRRVLLVFPSCMCRASTNTRWTGQVMAVFPRVYSRVETANMEEDGLAMGLVMG